MVAYFRLPYPLRRRSTITALNVSSISASQSLSDFTGVHPSSKASFGVVFDLRFYQYIYFKGMMRGYDELPSMIGLQ